MNDDTRQVSPERWARIQALFHDALALPRSERSAYVVAQSAGDDDLARDVEALLAGHDDTDAALDRVIAEVADDAAARGSQRRGRIGPYRIVRPLGEGGMGAVYLAERDDDEFRQRVAVKVVKNPALGDEVLKRFRSERQILANLNHPNIAHLHDGGSDEHGLPYIVMEYVEGEPIDEYCDRHRLGTRERIELFCNVCSAVQVAHQNLVVHRDLKPGNILVTPDGTPKLLDFGIAKLLAPAGAAQSVAVTQLNARVLTPEHASPEQIQGKPITTASDVYSLGVLLYQLLTGTRPYALATHSPGELERAICETQPPKPSTAVVSASTTTQPMAEAGSPSREIGRRRNTTLAALRKTLSGDLDNIVLKALRKEPQRRYGSAQAFADDLGRFLRCEPVEARPETWRYVATRFLQRNAGGVAAGAVTLGVVIGLVAFYTARLSAERDAAQVEAAKADQIAAFLMQLFEVSDPWQSDGGDVTARELLDRGASRVAGELAGQPEVQARMMSVIGEVYDSLMLHESALPLATRALEIREAELGADHPDVVASRHRVADVYYGLGRFDEARALFEQVLVARVARYGENAPEIADVLSGIGNAYFQEADYDAAEPYFARTLRIERARQPADRPALADALMNLGALLRHRGSYDESETYYLEALALRRAHHGHSHPDVAETLNHLARLETQRGDYDAAEPYAREALAMRRELLGNDHPAVGASAGSLASIVFAQGDLAEAEALRREGLEILAGAFSDDHLYVSGSMYSLGRVLAARGKYDEAEPLMHEALALIRKQFPAGSPRIAFPLVALGEVRFDRGDPAGAQDYFEEALDILLPKLGDAHPRVATARLGLGRALASQDRFDDAERALRASYDTRLSVFGPSHANTTEVRKALVETYDRWGRPDRAAELRRD